MNFLKFTNKELSLDAVSQLVVSPTCGAISLFVGTTRNYFDEKRVVTLEYEAYESMALEVMEDLCRQIRNQWKTVENVAIYHRLGSVPVKEASVIIAISSPHRAEAIQATEWCIDNLKKSVPIWKKETYDSNEPQWKENKESLEINSNSNKIRQEIRQEVEIPNTPPHLIQIKAAKDEILRRIETFMENKRDEININNISEFCSGDRNSEFTCARIDAVFKKRKDSKGHLQVDRVLNNYCHRDQMNSDYLTKYMPSNGIEERFNILESQLSLSTCVPKNIYKRLKFLEDRMLKLESISPEYIQFWDNTSCRTRSANKKVFTLSDIDHFIQDLEEKVEKPSL